MGVGSLGTAGKLLGLIGGFFAGALAEPAINSVLAANKLTLGQSFNNGSVADAETAPLLEIGTGAAIAAAGPKLVSKVAGKKYSGLVRQPVKYAGIGFALYGAMRGYQKYSALPSGANWWGNRGGVASPGGPGGTTPALPPSGQVITTGITTVTGGIPGPTIMGVPGIGMPGQLPNPPPLAITISPTGGR